MYIYKYNSPLGGITLSGDEKGLSGLWFDGQKYFGGKVIRSAEMREIPVFRNTKKWLDIYFEGKEPDFIPPLYMEDTSFRKAVWDILLTIPYGHTMTYKEIANTIASKMGVDKMSAQAVGGSVSHNPISIIIPCHRVVGAKGSLTGYAGGIDKKIKLLTLEGVDTGRFFVPSKGSAL